jgi:hypothetical protein
MTVSSLLSDDVEAEAAAVDVVVDVVSSCSALLDSSLNEFELSSAMAVPGSQATAQANTSRTIEAWRIGVTVTGEDSA